MRLRGFTIIEMSVVLTVMALIAGGALAVSASRTAAKKNFETREKMEDILDIIDRYVEENGYLPCPADPTLDRSHDDFGDGEPGPETENDGDCQTTPDNNTEEDGGTNVYIGALPTRQLGLSLGMATDAWGRRFTYAVDEDLTDSTGFDAEDPQITIYNTSGGAVIADKAAIVLVSHGANGLGAWPGKGGNKMTASGDDDEIENSNTDSVDQNFVQKSLTETFDDIVVYRLKWQFP